MRTRILEVTSFPQGPSYRVLRQDPFTDWPKEDGFRLGMAGIWNLLFRAGANPVIVTGSELTAPCAGEVLYVSSDDCFPQETEILLLKWLGEGGRIVATGNADAWRFVLPAGVNVEIARYDNPYAALGWIFEDADPQLIAPPKWPYTKILTQPDRRIKCYGRIAALHGERQTPSRALITVMDEAPAIVRFGNVWYFNGNPFAAFQSWMQGQEDLEPWMAWRHRLFWLDEFGAYLCKTLRTHDLIPQLITRMSGLAEITVVLKHDLDFSRDTTYLELENKANIAGVYPVLRDSNTAHWVRKLGTQPKNESAFHFNTARYSRVVEAARNLLLNLPKRPARPDKNAIQGNGLLEQVMWAKRHGVGIETLHRHASFLIYPELVDALDRVYKELPEVLGSNSFFRAQILRWGADVVDGMRGTLGSFPGPQFPYWFPFRLAHAGDGGRMLRGWESTCMMECEPDLVWQLLDHDVPDLTQRVIVLNYHPAHANGKTFSAEGCKGWFSEIVAELQKRGIPITNLRDVYQACNKSSALAEKIR